MSYANSCRTSFSCDTQANPYAQYLLDRCDCLSLDLESLVSLPMNCPCRPLQPRPAPENEYLNMVSTVPQWLSHQSAVAFSEEQLSQGSCISYHGAPSYFTLSCPGVYLVEYNADVTIDLCCPNVASLELRLDSQPIPGSRSTSSINSGEYNESLSASTLVQIPSGQEKRLTLEKVYDHDLIIKSANMVIVKLS